MKRKGFTLEQHRETGRTAYQARELLLKLCDSVNAAYGKTKRQSQAATKALRWLDSMRSALDDAVVAENPTHLDRQALIRIYYPGRGGPT